MWHRKCHVKNDKLFVMNIEHSHRHIYNPANYSARGFNMKQLIFWIMAVLAFICIVAFGLMVVGYTLNVRV